MSKKLNDKKQTGILVLKNGKVWDSKKGKAVKADVVLSNGKIDMIGKVDGTVDDSKIVDLKGSYVLPGLLDMHVHLREPGFEEKETIETGCNAAAVGGFTAVACMPNTNPVIDSQEIVNFVKDKAKDHIVSVLPIGAVSKKSKGEELSEISFMLKAGAVAISDDGLPVHSPELMLRALEYCRRFDIPIISHAEEKTLTSGTSMNEGLTSTKLGLKGMPSVAEEIMISRDIQLAEYTGGKLHIAHVSTMRGVELIREAKAKGINVTGEAAPHHFALTDVACMTYDTNFKMSPPLREAKDVAAVIEGLRDGTLDVIATDHAPHHIDYKDCEFDQAAFGVIGLETAVAMYFTELVDKHEFDELKTLVERFVVRPREILNIDVPQIEKGQKAELCIIDPKTKWTVTTDAFYSKSHNSCFMEKEVRGTIMGVVNNGRVWLR